MTNDSKRRRRTEVLERPQYGWIWKPLVVLFGIYLIVVLALGIWWSRPPAALNDGEARVEEPAALVGMTLQHLLDKPGGYLRNDIAPPGLWLDNMPSWEYGVLRQARVLLSELPAADDESAKQRDNLAKRLEGDARSWLYPSTEHRLRQVIEGLKGYPARATDAQPEMAMNDWLRAAAAELDRLGRQLSASVGNPEAFADLGLEASSQPEPTPWYRLDDVFFEARGQTWALSQWLDTLRAQDPQAVAHEAQWNALASQLELSQRRLWSPVILNGSGFGIFTNHSLVMASHVLRARDLMQELATMGE